jgi:hypothetical protein
MSQIAANLRRATTHSEARRNRAITLVAVSVAACRIRSRRVPQAAAISAEATQEALPKLAALSDCRPRGYIATCKPARPAMAQRFDWVHGGPRPGHRRAREARPEGAGPLNAAIR